MKNKRHFQPVQTLFSEFVLPKIRTYRIPYVGSKNAIASRLIECILTKTGNHGSRRFVDAFCGGGAIMYGIQQTRMFRSILGNDLHADLIKLHRNLPDLDLYYIARTPCILLPNATVQDKYPFVKLIDEIDTRYQMAFRVVYSFGNHCQTNLWGGDMIVKYDFARRLFYEPDSMGQAIAAFVGSDTVIPFSYTGKSISSLYDDYKRHIGMYRKGKQLEQLERLERLERLQQLQQLQRLQQLQQLEHSIKLSHVGYDQIEYKPNDVVYFDPPYKSTLDYHGIWFDNNAFEDFARSLKVPVFISEYQPEIKGFQPVLQIGKLSTMKNKGSNKEQKQRFEYLHWNGIG